MNADITSKTVRLINKYGVMHGIVSLDVAIGMANNEDLDLVEINSTSNPVVCKIMNFSKYKYELKKKKQIMDLTFDKNSVGKDHPDFIYDKRVEFSPNGDKGDWDSDNDEEEKIEAPVLSSNEAGDSDDFW